MTAPTLRIAALAMLAGLASPAGIAAAANEETIFVDIDAPPGGDGLSWDSAFDDLEPALALAAQIDGSSIWIAEGVYLPSVAETPGNDRTRRFALPSGVSLLGGFAGTECSPQERNPSDHPTWLSGDLLGNDGPDGAGTADNAFHVVVATSLAAPVLLDAVNIRSGSATGSTDPTRRGGALFATASTLTLVGCRVESNRATFNGGGLRLEQCDTTLDGCILALNTCPNSAGSGGAASVVGGKLSASSCVLSANSVFSGNAGGSGGALAVEAAAVLLEGCVVNGNFAANGAVQLLNSTWEIVGCHFLGNLMTSTGKGGGVRAFGGTGSILGSLFKDNGAGGRYGGGFAMEAPSQPEVPPTVTIEACSFVDNAVTDAGGALWVQSLASLVLRDCLVQGNSCGLEGGGLGAAQSLAMAVTLERCVFEGNASLDGGGVALGLGCAATMTECDLVENFADDDGGGLFSSSSPSQPTTVTLDRCSIRRNIAFGDGGGASLQVASSQLRDCAMLGNAALAGLGGGLHAVSGATSVQRCTIAGNDALQGGGLHVAGGACSVIGAILAQNTASAATGAAAQLSIAAGASAPLSWSCVPGLPPATPGQGNLATEPGFVDLPGADGAFGTDDDAPELASGSLCANRGAPGLLPPAAEDVAGAARVQLCRVDIGAFESPWPPLVADDCNGNGALDECDVADGLDGDCNLDGVLDGCEIASGVADCDSDGVPDPCQFAAGGFDCDGDQVIDTCAIAAGAVVDCDRDGVVDACVMLPAPIASESPALAPFGTGQPKSWTFTAPPQPITSVTLTFQCKADISAVNEFVSVSLNGVALGNVFVSGATDCAVPFSQASLSISAVAFLAATGGGDATVNMVPSSAVAANGCSGASFIKVLLTYGTVPINDLDQDGILDVCELGDLDGDNVVGPADLGLLLAAWGECPDEGQPCPADLDGNGVVDGGDLGLLVSLWE